MPRNASNQYSLPPGTFAQPNTTVASAPYNSAMQDVQADLNTPRPVSAGGTGETTITAAREALGAMAIDDVAAVFRGCMMTFAMTTPPSGWLLCDGSAVSRVTYSELFDVIGTTYGVGNGTTTFNVPDMRGVFARGLDLGRGIDTGRTLGSSQTDDVKAHTHTGTTSEAGAHSHTYNAFSIGVGSDISGGSGWGPVVVADTTNTAGSHTHTVTVASSGGTESRPKNIALVYCIKF